MNIRIILWTGSVFIGACSIHQQRHAESSQKVSAGRLHVQSDSLFRRDTLTELFGRQFFQENEVLDIRPLGSFTYRPDSGFKGQASHIRIYRKKTHQADTLQRRQGSDASQSSRQQVAQKVQTTRTDEIRTNRKAGFRWGWLGCLLLLPVLWYLYRWFRNR